MIAYGSVCSGIEAASVAWHPLGWKAAFVSEIDKFPRAVLAHHYPEVPLHGDFTTIQDGDYRPINLLVGGTPCQSFSIAGLRGGLDDDRGNLSLEFLKLAQRLRPRWVVWENVPGVLSSNGGRDFGSILAGLGEVGYGFAYRVLDAQYFGLAQRRKRVFVVGYLGDWRRAAAVLFERESLSGHPAPQRKEGERIAACLGVSAASSSSPNVGNGQGNVIESNYTKLKWPADIAPTLNAAFGSKQGLENQHINGGCGLFVPATTMCVSDGQSSANVNIEVSPTLNSSHEQPYIAQTFSIMPMNSGKDYKARAVDISQPIMASGPAGGNQGGDVVALASAVRRLTPTECERLQGFPDGYTDIPWRGNTNAPDGPRYKALGNSMAVPVMRWIGERIQIVDNLP